MRGVGVDKYNLCPLFGRNRITNPIHFYLSAYYLIFLPLQPSHIQIFNFGRQFHKDYRLIAEEKICVLEVSKGRGTVILRYVGFEWGGGSII